MSESLTAASAARGSPESRAGRRRLVVAGATIVVPFLAWAGSLGGSYVLQDFTCLNYASAGTPAAESNLQITLTLLNLAMLVITVVSGAVAGWILRRAADGPHPELLRFLGFVGGASALTCAFSVILIGIQPLLLEVCS